MSIYYRTLIQTGRLLDIYPNASAAFSLRKLRDGYTGASIEARRSVDNAVLDIGFLSNGELDTQSCLDFVGYNIMNWSQTFENASWTKSGLVTTGTPPYIDVAVAPDGTTTADKMIESAANVTHRVTKGFSYTLGNTYNSSVYLKAGERRYCQILMSVGVANQTMNIDLLTGTILSNSFTSARLTSVGSGWYRFDADLTPTVTQSATMLISIQQTASGSLTYLGDGTSGIYVWGMQTSFNFGVKLYTPTTSTICGTGFIETWYDQSGNGRNATQGTFLSQWHIVLNSQITTNSLTGRICGRIAQNGYYNMTSSIPVTSPHLATSVYYFNGTNAFGTWGNRNVVGFPNAIYQTSTTIRYRLTNNSGDDLTASFNTAGNFITTASRVVNDMNIYINNNLIANKNTAFVGATTPVTAIGSFASSGNIGPGDMFEMIYWQQNYMSIRNDITNKINEYYGFY